MRQRVPSLGRAPRSLLAVLALLAAIGLTPAAAAANFSPAKATTSGTVLQTDLVSDLPGVAAVTDGNLVNPWGISESATSPFWISDNGAGLATLYNVPGAGNTPVSINPLAVSIPTPVSVTGGTPTGTVFNPSGTAGAFPITGPDKAGQATSLPAVFLFATEDGTIVGWNPGVDPTGRFDGPNGASTHAVIAMDHSGNNFTNPDPGQQTGAVYKGLAVATSSTPIIPADADSTALLYVSNFRAGVVEVYDAKFNRVTALPAGAFRDPRLPAHYAPFNVQALGGKIYVSYARQNATGHDDVAGPHRGFVDVFNPDGNPGLPNGKVRLISRGPLDSPWGLAIAPQAFAGLGPPHNDPVLLVGNFGNGFINAFDATTGTPLGQLKDPDGEPIQIDGLWTLKFGNGGSGGAANTLYFTAGPFGESHGLFGSLSTAAPGSPEGPAEAQWVRANVEVVQLDLQQLIDDSSSGASAATIRQDVQTLDADSQKLSGVERAFAQDTLADAGR
ncbi:MAG: TIGR03118 family protein [Solirubrobacterales bacterium]|nr:TIGR03118 family protein [Solirubrobacterales bacterium]